MKVSPSHTIPHHLSNLILPSNFDLNKDLNRSAILDIIPPLNKEEEERRRITRTTRTTSKKVRVRKKNIFKIQNYKNTFTHEKDNCVKSTLLLQESIVAVPSLFNVMTLLMDCLLPPALTLPLPPNQPQSYR